MSWNVTIAFDGVSVEPIDPERWRDGASWDLDEEQLRYLISRLWLAGRPTARPETFTIPLRQDIGRSWILEITPGPGGAEICARPAPIGTEDPDDAGVARSDLDLVGCADLLDTLMGGLILAATKDRTSG